MKVKLLEMCFHDNQRFYAGDVIELKEIEVMVKNPNSANGFIKKVVSAEEQFSERYMEKLEGKEAVKEAVKAANSVPHKQKRQGSFREQVVGDKKVSDDDVL